MKLFCLPYAGGSSVIYSSWKKYINSSIELCPIELTGRGKRYNEPFYSNINEAVEDVYKQIKDEIIEDEYAIFGHSMGSLIAYELCHKIIKEKDRNPEHVFFSGYKAPNIPYDEEQTYNLSDDEFKEKILEMGGTPKEFFECKELYEIFMPVIRSDFKIVELYEFKQKESKLPINISVLNGKEDEIKINEILDWRNHIQGDCKVYMLDGDHFYINDNVENIAKIINYTLVENL